MTRAPKLNRDRLRLLTGAAGVVLGEDHPTTRALARGITTWEPSDVTRARIRVRQLDMYLRVLLDDLCPDGPGREPETPLGAVDDGPCRMMRAVRGPRRGAPWPPTAETAYCCAWLRQRSASAGPAPGLSKAPIISSEIFLWAVIIRV